ncbi:GAF domain-containing protein, partial [Fischerella thermalis]
MKALPNIQERARLAALHHYQILDTVSETAFDHLVQLAVVICGTPIACINFIDENRQWIKAKVGWDVTELPYDVGMCPICIQQRDVFIVSDSLADQVWAENPITATPYDVRFYAGVPLVTPEGYAIATLCVMDHQPRQLNAEQVKALQVLAQQAMLLLYKQSTNTILRDCQHVEAALRENEQRLKLALQAGKLGSWQVDLKTGELFASNQCKANFGLPPKIDFSYQMLFDCIHPDDRNYQLVHPEDREQFAELLYQHLELNQPYQMELRLRRVDGSYNWFLIRGKVIRDHNGRSLRMVGVLSDISERKRTEEELKQQNQRSQLLAEIALKIRQSLQAEEILQTTVTEIQKLLHTDRVIIFRLWSDGFGTVVQEALINGCSSILGRKLFDSCFLEHYQEAYRQGRVNVIPDVKTENIHPCHREFLENTGVKSHIIVPIIVRETLWGLLIAQQCIRPRNWSSWEIELLQQLATQIGIALAKAQLLEQERHRREELARSNAELEQFAYVASHDLQEPLRMVTSYLQLLERKYKSKLDSKADEFITYAVDGARRMQTLINDLLSFSRVSTRGQPFGVVDCHIVLRQALANLKVAITETHAVITHDEPLPQLIADSTQMVQVFQNLISNAIKFRSEQPPQIHIGVARTDGEVGRTGGGEN